MKECKTLPVWQGLEKAINKYLDGITLQDILNDYRKAGADDYYI
jgi:DNA-binding IscR family transcriptional regulator